MKLKPCPFCGSDDVSVIDIAKVWMVKCESCLACGTVTTKENTAIKAWNRRAK